MREERVAKDHAHAKHENLRRFQPPSYERRERADTSGRTASAKRLARPKWSCPGKVGSLLRQQRGSFPQRPGLSGGDASGTPTLLRPLCGAVQGGRSSELVTLASAASRMTRSVAAQTGRGRKRWHDAAGLPDSPLPWPGRCVAPGGGWHMSLTSAPSASRYRTRVQGRATALGRRADLRMDDTLETSSS